MSEPQLTGMAKHFNSVTFTGRANVAKVLVNNYDYQLINIFQATYAAIILTVVAVKAKNAMQSK